MTNSSSPASLGLVRELLTEIAQPCAADADPAEVTLRQLGLDSLSVLELLMLIDERTGVEIAVEQVGENMTLAGLASLIDRPAVA